MGGKSTKPVYARTIQEFDIDKYMGCWYQIIATKAWFNRDCESAFAVYYRQKDDVIFVANYCVINGVVSRSVEGSAINTNSYEPGQLVIDFGFGRVGNYWIYETDYDNYSLVGDGKGKNFWILSRHHTMTQEDVEEYLLRMEKYGYVNNTIIASKNAIV